MKALYIKLRDLLLENKGSNYLYLCRLSARIDPNLLTDVKARLINLKESDPDLYDTSLCNRRVTPEKASKENYAFWFSDDFDSRFKFISRIIEKL